MNTQRKHKITNELLKVSKSQIFEEALKEFKYIRHFKKPSHQYIEFGQQSFNKKRCLCHGMLKAHFHIIFNEKTGTPVMVGNDCLKLFPNMGIERFDVEYSHIRDLYKIKYDKKEIDFDIFKNINDALTIMEYDNHIHQKIARIKAICKKVTEKIGSNIVDFGKYNGKPVLWVVNNHPNYTRFILSNKFKPIRRTFNIKEYMFYD